MANAVATTHETLPLYWQPAHLTDQQQRWLQTLSENASEDAFALLPSDTGTLAGIYQGLPFLTEQNTAANPSTWSLANLPKKVPTRDYQLAKLPATISPFSKNKLSLGWELGRYQYGKEPQAATLTVPGADTALVETLRKAVFQARDLINSPPNILGPKELANTAIAVAEEFGGNISQYTGEQLLAANFPLVHTVGRASSREPWLVDFTWGNESDPKLTLVGKGVIFDSGGLDIKSSSGMKLMKKDMGGAAQVLALARVIMAQQLPVRLRVLLPCVENSVSGNAYRTSDVVTARNGTTIEIGNTDAEGRLILADCLAAASEENPDLLIDCATLTGAARVAVGTDIAAMFTNDDDVASGVMAGSEEWDDPVWRLPLHKEYQKKLKSAVADTSSTGAGQGGAITAALFLQKFVGQDDKQHIPWLHLDFMAWRTESLPGRPKGGDPMGLLAIFSYLQTRYGTKT